MPVRSWNSSVLKWPDRKAVDRALRQWAERVAASRRDVRGIAYFGSYARGDWGFGSDLDVVIIVETSDKPFEERGCEWDLTEIPVPVDLLIYTVAEWEALGKSTFRKVVEQEGVWVYRSHLG
jgi:predicted nucleotidyltransferase